MPPSLIQLPNFRMLVCTTLQQDTPGRVLSFYFFWKVAQVGAIRMVGFRTDHLVVVVGTVMMVGVLSCIPCLCPMQHALHLYSALRTAAHQVAATTGGGKNEAQKQE
jgi:hypothetical protein